MIINHTYCLFLRPILPITSKRWNGTLKRIDKILIANRGEIACRIIRTADRLGVQSVAVFSDADAEGLHVKMATEAYHIGPSPAIQSYLRGEKILDIAKRTNCQAVHPGYGFLSENVEFAEECQRHEIIFIGPPPNAIRDMGIKSTSKLIMSKAGVPIIEGYHGEDQSTIKLISEAKRIGYPVMIKAVRGGGGKGMRVAYTESEFEDALQSARTEAEKAFGDSAVLLERFIAQPRHVEVQVFADTLGNAVHLFERDCSVQRRHQKIIEEAPAPGISEELRSELGTAAVKAAKAVGYVGAGTVEFILDRHTHSFHFMEMNTRLQVEHPITEMITGTDLVEWQIKVASGEPLPLTQEEIVLNGHAFEARIYAEDPRSGFLPGAGTIHYLSTPAVDPDTRIETGIQEGDEVPVHYDPMIAKLVVWGSERKEALGKLQAKLIEYNIAGLETNVGFLINLVKNEEFILGNVHTNFINENYNALFKDEYPTENELMQAALAMVLTEELEEAKKAIKRRDQFNPFIVEAGFRVNHSLCTNLKLRYVDKIYTIQVKYTVGNYYLISIDQGVLFKRVSGELLRNGNKVVLRCIIGDEITTVNIYKSENSVIIFDQNGKNEFIVDKQILLLDEEEELGGGGKNKAASPMPGVVDKVLVKAGDSVKKGDPLFVIIAMKMEHVVKANADAVIENIFYGVGDNVAKDAVVVQLGAHHENNKQ